MAVALFEPLVIKKGNHYTGFEIDLWEKIAQQLNIDYEYSEYVFPELLPTLSDQKADIACAGITVNEEREGIYDFSHRTFDSGLHILVAGEEKNSIVAAVKTLLTRDLKNIILFLFGFVFVAGHLMWLVERGPLSEFSDKYFPGIFEAFWWGIVTVSTVGYGDFSPLTWIGRIVGSFVILSGLGIFGLYIAQISSVMTMKALRSDIRDEDDLKGRRIATVENSTSVDELKKIGAQIFSVKKIDEAYRQLDMGAVDAVVFDAPVLLSFVRSKGRKYSIVGKLFKPQSYGFAFPQGSQLVEKVNRIILHLRESGEYELLYKKWFGE